MTVPILETARLRLRAHTLRDFEACCAMWSDPAVTRFIGGRAFTPQQTWQRILAYLGHWQTMNYGYWAIEDRSTGSYIGEAGFSDFKRDLASHMRDVPELGFALASQEHGKGYAGEAVRSILDWGDSNLPSKRTVALAHEDNASSIYILKKNGYEPFGHADLNGSRVALFER
jgi:RimJ/RimL family protein N-acetyltransferase